MIFDCSDPVARVSGLVSAADAISRQKLVAIPTDTVYGLACDAFSAIGVYALNAAKQRDVDTPLPVFVGSWNTIHGLMTVVPDDVWELVTTFWPGPLTLVVRRAPSIHLGQPVPSSNLLVRMPLHPVAIELLESTGPLAVTSALKGFEVATVNDVAAELDGHVDVLLDGGPAGGRRSTILDCSGTRPVLLRDGPVTFEELRDVLGENLYKVAEPK